LNFLVEFLSRWELITTSHFPENGYKVDWIIDKLCCETDEKIKITMINLDKRSIVLQNQNIFKVIIIYNKIIQPTDIIKAADCKIISNPEIHKDTFNSNEYKKSFVYKQDVEVMIPTYGSYSWFLDTKSFFDEVCTNKECVSAKIMMQPCGSPKPLKRSICIHPKHDEVSKPENKSQIKVNITETTTRTQFMK
jgi:hypothetical protein